MIPTTNTQRTAESAYLHPAFDPALPVFAAMLDDGLSPKDFRRIIPTAHFACIDPDQVGEVIGLAQDVFSTAGERDSNPEWVAEKFLAIHGNLCAFDRLIGRAQPDGRTTVFMNGPGGYAVMRSCFGALWLGGMPFDEARGGARDHRGEVADLVALWLAAIARDERTSKREQRLGVGGTDVVTWRERPLLLAAF